MNRRAFVTGLGAALIVPLDARAQQTGKIYRIGIVTLGGPEYKDHPIFQTFRLRLWELGYIDGQNVTIEFRFASGRAERLDSLAAELVRLNVDVVYASGASLPAVAAKRATNTIPIVFEGVGSPVESGFVESLARPGGNMTGTTVFPRRLEPKQLELLKAFAPVSTVGVVFSPEAPKAYRTLVLGELEEASRKLNVVVRAADVDGAKDDLDEAIATLVRSRVDALIFAPSPYFYVTASRITALTVRYRLPSISIHREFAVAGGLLAYGTNSIALARRSADYVAKILSGVKPSDLPVEEPTKFELVINLKTAKALGLTIPQSLLLRADQVIE